MTLKTTDELVVGDVVATSKVGVEAVTRAAPGARGAWRTIEGIRLVEANNWSHRTHVITFTDGTNAAAEKAWYWRLKEVGP